LFIIESLQTIKIIYENEINKRRNVKTTMIIGCVMRKNLNKTVKETVYFHSSSFENANVILNKEQIKKNISKLVALLQKRFDEFIQRGSDWVLDHIINLQINSIKFKPFKGASYIDLPPRIKNSQSCINVQNDDNKCFFMGCFILYS